jgi:hypothetical protein
MKTQISRKTKKSQGVLDRNASSSMRDRRFWMMRIEPMEQVTISETLTPCLMVVQNHGPGKIRIDAGYGDQVDLMPGKVRITRALQLMRIGSKDENPAVIEFEVMPTIK